MLPVAMAVKLAVAAIIPKAVETAWDYVFGDEPEVKPVHLRKKSDTTKLSTAQKASIRHWHNEYVHGDMDANTQLELTAFLNHQLNLDKGVTAYAKIWSPKSEPEEAE